MTGSPFPCRSRPPQCLDRLLTFGATITSRFSVSARWVTSGTGLIVFSMARAGELESLQNQSTKPDPKQRCQTRASVSSFPYRHWACHPAGRYIQ